MKLIFLGAPGAGKGTQAEIVSKRLSIPIISTGNILKDAVRRGTELGKKAEEYMSSGHLVPDDIIIGILQQRIAGEDCQDGFILDGVPRTLAQAEALREMDIDVDRVISLEVSDEAILERLSGRRTCPKCGSTYHISYKQPAVEGVCDACGEALVIRDDDKEETIKTRLRVYHETTEQLKGYYDRLGKLREVAGCEDVADTTRATLAALEV